LAFFYKSQEYPKESTWIRNNHKSFGMVDLGTISTSPLDPEDAFYLDSAMKKDKTEKTNLFQENIICPLALTNITFLRLKGYCKLQK